MTKRFLTSGVVIIILFFAGTALTQPTLWTPFGMGNRGMGSMMNAPSSMKGVEKEDVVLNETPPPETKANIARGKMIYEQRCVFCHGEKGDGKGMMVGEFKTKPRDFTKGLYKFRSTPMTSIPFDRDIVVTITRGIRGTAMVPQKDLPERERWLVAYYIKTFSERFKEEVPEPPITILDIAVNPEMIEQGRRVYEKSNCIECHGEKGKGDGKKALELIDDWGRPIRPRDFSLGIFKGGGKPEDIYRSIATGLIGTPMDSYLAARKYPSALSKEELAALSVYVRSLAPAKLPDWGVTSDEQAGFEIISMHRACPMHRREFSL